MGKHPSTAAIGDVKWSSFAAREANSRMAIHRRLTGTENEISKESVQVPIHDEGYQYMMEFGNKETKIKECQYWITKAEMKENSCAVLYSRREWVT